MKIFMEPNDVLMFRDGRPFAGGDDHFARGIFPPSPATIYGALRSHILSNESGEFDTYKGNTSMIAGEITREIGTPGQLGSLLIRQFTPAGRNADGLVQFFPMPKDVVKEKGGKERLHMLSPMDLSGSRTVTDLPEGLSGMWMKSEEAMEAVRGFLSSEEMERCLLGETPRPTEPEKLFRTEERTGIGKSRVTRSVETGRLYSVEYFRLADGAGFAVEVEGTRLLPGSGMMRLGGDHRSIKYETSSWRDIEVEPVKKMIADRRRFKFVLTTPAIFRQGWLPGWINPETKKGDINGVRVKLTGACVGRPVGIGGYDLIKNMPKEMKKAVPAGSVYFFEIKEGDPGNLFEMLWLKSISEEKSREGFGITLIGGY